MNVLYATKPILFLAIILCGNPNPFCDVYSPGHRIQINAEEKMKQTSLSYILVPFFNILQQLLPYLFLEKTFKILILF